MAFLQHALIQCKTLLQCKKDGIRQLWIENVEYTEMVRLLDTIEEIKKVPDKLDKLMEAKLHVDAAKLLIRTTNVLEGESLGSVRALHDLHRNLVHRSEQMHKQLIDELHCLIYKKGEHSSIEDSCEATTERDSTAVTLIAEALYVLRKIPEAVEALCIRMKGEISLVIEKTLAYAEEHILPDYVEPSTLSNPGLRCATVADQSGPRFLVKLLLVLYNHLLWIYCRHLDILSALRNLRSGSDMLLQAAEAGNVYNEREVWKTIQMELVILISDHLGVDEDFAIASFARAGAVAESSFSGRAVGHKRSDSGGGSAGTTVSEKKAGNISTSVAVGSIGDLSEETPTLFRFANSENALAEASVSVERGLSPHKRTSISTDTYTSANIRGVRQLCEPSLLNITGIYKPTLLFTMDIAACGWGEQRSVGAPSRLSNAVGMVNARKKVLAARESAGKVGYIESNEALQQFLSRFIRQRFLSQVYTDMLIKLKAVWSEVEKPIDNHGYQDAPHILLRGTIAVYDVMGTLCGLLLDLPTYANEFMNMLSVALRQYVTICSRQIGGLFRAPSRESQIRRGLVVLSAEWQQNEKVRRAVRTNDSWLFLHPESSSSRSCPDSASEHETDLILDLAEEFPVSKGDLITDVHILKSIAIMHESMRWIGIQIVRVVSLVAEDRNTELGNMWTDVGAVVNPAVSLDPDSSCTEKKRNSIGSVADSAKPNPIQKIASDFVEMSNVCAVVLRLEIRCHALKYLVPSIRKSKYYCDIEQVEADPLVVAFCKELLTLEKNLAASLSSSTSEFVFAGLSDFLSSLLIRNMKYMKRVNKHGIRRICRSIFALQQTLGVISKSTESESRVVEQRLDVAMKYYELLNLQAEEVLQGIIANGRVFSKSEYSIVLDIIAASQLVSDNAHHEKMRVELNDIFSELV